MTGQREANDSPFTHPEMEEIDKPWPWTVRLKAWWRRRRDRSA